MPGKKRRHEEPVSALQIAGLLIIIGLCAVYLYFVRHSSFALQVKFHLPAADKCAVR